MVDSGPETTGDRLNDVYHEILDDLAAGELRPVQYYQEKSPDHAEAIAGMHCDAARTAGQDSVGRPDPWPHHAASRTDFPSTPTHLGPYRIMKQLGRGGQGVVYLATDRRLGRQVALKVLADPSLFSEEALRRFRREAEITSRLDHPGICTVFESGSDRGRPYIAMRYVDGQPLSRRVRPGLRSADHETLLDLATDASQSPDTPPALKTPPSGPKTWKQIASTLFLLEKVARALHVAHEAGVVHRDIKPGNILVGSDGEPVIVDFGLARRLGDETVSVTLSGDFLGTPHYMAPEHLSDGTRAPDRRADIYSLGITLFECLTLRRPFESPTRDGILQAILHQETPNCREFNRCLSIDLGLVVRTAMERERERRYATALELAEDLRRVREGLPILARPLPRSLRLRRWIRRYPGVSATIAALVTTIAALAYYLIPGRVRVDTNPSGATIFVNDKLAGTTPLTVSIWPFGKAKIVARLEGFRQEEATAEPTRFGVAHQPLMNLRPARGRVMITSRQPGVTLRIQRVSAPPGDSQSVSLPLVWPIELAGGDYSLAASGPELVTRNITITVKNDEELNLQINLSRDTISQTRIRGERPTKILTEDLDGDGRQDFLIGSRGDSGTSVFDFITAVSGRTLDILWDREFSGEPCQLDGLAPSGPGGRMEIITHRITSRGFEVAVLAANTGRTIWTQEWSDKPVYFTFADDLAGDRDGIPDLVVAINPGRPVPTGRDPGEPIPTDLDYSAAFRIVDVRNRRSHLVLGFPATITSLPIAADLTGNGRPELCAGTQDGDVMIVDPHDPTRRRLERIGGRPCTLLCAGDPDEGGVQSLLIGTSRRESHPDSKLQGTDLLFEKAALFELLPDGPPRCIWVDREIGVTGIKSSIDRMRLWRESGTSEETRIAISVETIIDSDRRAYRIEPLRIGPGRRATPEREPLRLTGQTSWTSMDLTGDGIDELLVTGGTPGEGLRTVKEYRLYVLPGVSGAETYSEWLPGVTDAQMLLGDFNGLGGREMALLARSKDRSHPELTLRVKSAPYLPKAGEPMLSRELWVSATGDALWSSPATADFDRDGLPDVVVGSHDQHVHAFSGLNGRELWSYPTGGAVWSSPAVADLDSDGIKDVVVGSNDQCVHAISGDDRRQLWPPFRTGRNVVASPELVDVDADGIPDVIVGSHDESLYAISGQSGTKIWAYQPTERTFDRANWPLPPSFYARVTAKDLDADGQTKIVATNWNGWVFVFSLAGKLLWTYDAMAPIYAEASLADLDGDGHQDIVFGTWDGTVHVVSGRLHGPLWPPIRISSEKIESTAVLTPIDADGAPDILVTSQDGKLHALSGKDGSTLWRFTAPKPIWPSRALIDLDGDGINDVVLRCTDGFIYVVSGREGLLLDSLGPFGELYALPAITDLDGDEEPDVVAASYDHSVYAVRLPVKEYARRRTGVSSLARARQLFLQQQYVQALRILDAAASQEPDRGILRARCLFRLGRYPEALAAINTATAAGNRDPGLAAVHLLASGLARVPPRPELIVAGAATDPPVFLEALLDEDAAWCQQDDPDRFRSSLRDALNLLSGTADNSALVRAVFHLLLGERSPGISPEIYDGDPVTIDFHLVLAALESVILGGSPGKAEAQLSRMATEAGRRFARRWPAAPTELSLRKILHLPDRP